MGPAPRSMLPPGWPAPRQGRWTSTSSPGSPAEFAIAAERDARLVRPRTTEAAMNTTLTLLSTGLMQRYYAGGFWRDDTIYSLVRARAASRPEKYALRDRLRRITYGALVEAADRLAADLAHYGVRAGQRVAVWLPSRIEGVVALLACSRNRYVCCPSLHRDHTTGEIVGLLRRIRAAAFIGQPGYGDDADRRDVSSELGGIETLRRVHALAPAGDDQALFGDLAETAPVEAAVQDPNRIVYLAFTSGTTGEPKGVMHSDNTLLANARAMAADWRIDERIVLFSMSPLTHAIGTIAMAQALVSGFELVLNDLPKGRSALDHIIETHASYVMGVPTHAIDVVAEARRRRVDRLGKVNVFYMGGAAIPRETVRALMAMGVTPQSVYGMTENGAHQYTLPD